MRPIQEKDPYSFERGLVDMNRKRSENLANFRAAGGRLAIEPGGTKLPSAEYLQEQENPYKATPSYIPVIPAGKTKSYPSQISPNANQSGQVQGSFNRMMNIGEVGGLGGRMGELEKASMRLGEAASQRRMGETSQEYGLRGGLLEKEIAGIGTKAKASRKAEAEIELNQLKSSPPIDWNGRSEWKRRIDQLENELRGY